MCTVLLSFGLFAFAEISLRERLALFLSACIRTRSCQKDGGCSHRYKSNLLVTLPRACFVLMNTYQLVYLGSLIHSYGQFQWNIWIDEFMLFGHFLALIMLFICMLFDYSGILRKQEKKQHKKE